MATYLITGGCGFIGSHLAEALAADGSNRVVLYDNLSSGHIENVGSFRERVEIVEADIRDRDRLALALAGVDFVFHEAALVSVFDSVNRPYDNHEINITGSLNVLQAAAAAGVRRVVVASSAAVYGDNPELPKREEMRPEPVSPYALAKIALEYYGAVHSGLFRLPVVALRYFNVFGPRQDPSSPYSGVISRFTDRARRGERPTIYGDGRQSRDFVFVRDVVRANLLAMSCPALRGGEVFNIATGSATDLIGLMAAVNAAFGTALEPRFEPARAGDVRHSLADISLARAVLGYEPSCGLAEGLVALAGG